MTNQSYYTNPAEKKIKTFQDFSGGLNTVTSHDNMADNEMTYIRNMSFDERGAIGRRTGMTSFIVMDNPNFQNAQMYFRHYKTAYTYDELLAVDGQMFLNGVLQEHVTFQADRIIEAVQWYQTSIIATGSGLYTYDGTEIKKIEPYAPDPLSALYIGTNAIAEDPDNFLSDGVGSTLQLAGVTFSDRYGVMNEPFTVEAFHIKPEEMEVEYCFEYRSTFEVDGVFHLGQDWSSSKSWTFTPEGESTMQFRIKVRDKVPKTPATEDKVAVYNEAQYLVPKYVIKPALDPADIKPELSGIHTCNRILLHWERLIIYGDTTNVNTIYISHLKRFDYFPVPNTLFFETTRNEPVNTVVRFRDYLLAFTDTSTQALFGQSPSDFNRRVLNSAVGCIAPRGATVMDNYVAFMSADGIYYLKSVGYVDDKANVGRLDTNITNLIPNNVRDCVMTVFDDQLQVTFPTQKQRARYSKVLGTWTFDESPYLDIVANYIYDNELYGQRLNGNIVKFSHEVYDDLGYVYPAIFETRFLDFGMPYHSKKLKELQLLAKSENSGQVATVKVFMDGAQKVDTPLDWEATLVTPQEYNTFVDKLKVSGKCLRVKIRVEHNLAQYIQVLGFSIVHKLKKP